MAGHRVLLVDDNQIFGSQVVAAFADAGIPALWVARGSEALPFLHAEAMGPELMIVDLVRPASAGRWLLDRISARTLAQKPLSLALVPVIGTFHDLPEGVEVQVKPIFPSQLVASARRLLGLASPVSGMPRGAPAQSGAAVHRLQSTVPTIDTVSDQPTAAHIPQPLPEVFDVFEDSSDFGPADTLLSPSNIEELARAMVAGSTPLAQVPAYVHDELFDSPELAFAAPARANNSADETTAPRAPIPPRTERPLAPPPNPPAQARKEPQGESGETEPISRTIPLLLTRSAPPLSMVALAGDLAAVALIDIVTLLGRQRQRGVLCVTSDEGGEKELNLYFRDGRIDLGTAVGFSTPENDLRIGRFLMEAAAISREQLEELEARWQEKKRTADRPSEATPSPQADLLGQRACQAGLLDRSELEQALSRQTAELLYTALRLRKGRFVFDLHMPPPRHALLPELGGALGLDAEALLLEGYRRNADFHLIEKDAEEGAVYLSTAPTADPLGLLGLSDGEVMVLGLCNGRHSLAEIAKESHLPILEVARTVQRLQALGLCRRRLPALLAS